MTAGFKMSVCVAALAMLAGPPQSAFAADVAHPTVVELFQSQGCSSCPPAEANVGAIGDRSDVLALAFEVELIGIVWAGSDTLLQARLDGAPVCLCPGDGSRRRLHAPGGRQRPGRGRWSGAGRCSAGPVSRGDRGSRRSERRRTFRWRRSRSGQGAAPAGGADVWLARCVPRTVEVAITRGENAGHTLSPYKDVVAFEMVLLGHWRRRSGELPPGEGASEPGALAEAAIVKAMAAGPDHSRRQNGDLAFKWASENPIALIAPVTALWGFWPCEDRAIYVGNAARAGCF